MKTIGVESRDYEFVREWERAQQYKYKPPTTVTSYMTEDGGYVVKMDVPDNYVPAEPEDISFKDIDRWERRKNGDLVHIFGILTCVVEKKGVD